ncbi:hypothetical protein ACWKW6_11765 [Dyadobacter jiangsuensis]
MQNEPKGNVTDDAYQYFDIKSYAGIDEINSSIYSGWLTARTGMLF